MVNKIEDEEIIKNKSLSKTNKKNYFPIIIYFLFVILFINLFFYFFFVYNIIKKNLNVNLLNKDIINKIKELLNKNSKINLIDNNQQKDFENEEFNENINNKIKKNQLYFCSNDDLFIDKKIENNIEKFKINFNNNSFNMFLYKTNDIISEALKNSGVYEEKQIINALKCLDYYSQKKKLNKNEITILDLGANVGWYSFFLGKLGYELISFEVSNINIYILKRNFCLNKDINITIINKGIDLEEKNCILHHPSNNIGNGVVLCGDSANIALKNEQYVEVVKFTKLSNYYSFLFKKNLAFMKIDIEGSEGKAINSGIELIASHHIPFILTEFTPDYLKMQGTDPKFFLETFEKNGYRISEYDFLSKNYSSIDKLLKLKRAYLYIIYPKFLS